MPVLRGEHILFSGQLRFAVNADRICFIFLGVRCAFFPIEYVIRAEVNQLRVFLPTNLGEHTRRFGVDPKSLIRLCFAKIDIGKCGSVNEYIEVCPIEFPPNLIKIREIELCVIEAGDVEFVSVLAH